MVKTVAAGMIALVAGLGLGVWFGVARVNAVRAEAAAAESAAAEARERIVGFERALSAREAELEQLRDELELARLAARREREMTAARPTDPMPDTADFLTQLAQVLDQEDVEAVRQENRVAPRREIPVDAAQRPEGEAERQRDDRRRAFAEDFRQRMNDFLQAQIDAAQDPAERQRIASIGEYTETLMEQRRLLRDAETDEEREAVLDAMRQNTGTLRSMVEEQRDEVMRQSLQRQGITSRSEQNAMIQAYKEAQSDPFFAGGFGFFGRGGGGFGGGMRGRGGPR